MPLDHHNAVVMVRSAMPAVVAHLGAGVPTVIPMMATTIHDNGLGARNRRQCQGECPDCRSDISKSLHLILLNQARMKQHND
jgi:hypothetical protein